MDSSLLTTALENRLLAILAALSFVLLIVVTLGVAYLTAVEWRDRRKRGRDATTIPSLVGRPSGGKKAISTKATTKTTSKSKRQKKKDKQ